MKFLQYRFLKLFGITLLLVGVFFLLRTTIYNDMQTQEEGVRTPDYTQGVVSSGDTTVQVAIADTQEMRAIGLSFTESLSEGQGMFFIFETLDIHGFWMKDMHYPIDIIWFSEDMRVVHIEHSVLPSTYPDIFFPASFAKYVLEVPAGFSTAKNIQKGQVFTLSRQ